MPITGINNDEVPFPKNKPIQSDVEKVRELTENLPKSNQNFILSSLIQFASKLTDRLGFQELNRLLRQTKYGHIIQESVRTKDKAESIFQTSPYKAESVVPGLQAHKISSGSQVVSSQQILLPFPGQKTPLFLIYPIPMGQTKFFQAAEKRADNWGILDAQAAEQILNQSKKERAFLVRFDLSDQYYVISEKEGTQFRHILINEELNWTPEELATYIQSTQEASYQLIKPAPSASLLIPHVQGDSYIIQKS